MVPVDFLRSSAFRNILYIYIDSVKSEHVKLVGQNR